MNYAVKERHATCQQQNGHQSGDAQIDEVEDAGSILRFGHQLAHNRSGHFRLEDVHGAVGQLFGDDRHQHQHAHAANPVGKAAPEQVAALHGFYIRQNGGAGGGKAADCFKKGIHIRGDVTAEDKGKSADGGEHQPANGHDGKALFGKDVMVFRTDRKGHQRSCQSCHSDGLHIGQGTSFAVVEGHQQRQNQQPGLQQHHLTDGVDHHFIVHGAVLLIGVG